MKTARRRLPKRAFQMYTIESKPCVFRNVGIGFFVNGFTLDVNVKKESWKGGAKTEQIGPLLTLTASW